MLARESHRGRGKKIREAAAWINQRRKAMRDELSGRSRPAAERFERCPKCKAPGNKSCKVCGGAGIVEIQIPADEQGLPQELAHLGELIEHWSMIDRYGVEGWRSLTQDIHERALPVDELFLQSLNTLGGEIDKLEAAEQIEAMDSE